MGFFKIPFLTVLCGLLGTWGVFTPQVCILGLNFNKLIKLYLYKIFATILKYVNLI